MEKTQLLLSKAGVLVQEFQAKQAASARRQPDPRRAQA